MIASWQEEFINHSNIMKPNPAQAREEEQTTKENELYKSIKDIEASIKLLKIERAEKVQKLGELFIERLESE